MFALLHTVTMLWRPLNNYDIYGIKCHQTKATNMSLTQLCSRMVLVSSMPQFHLVLFGAFETAQQKKHSLVRHLLGSSVRALSSFLSHRPPGERPLLGLR
jgi:hypothetical protein